VDGDEIGRKDVMKLCQLRVDRLAKLGDLLLIAHLDGDRNGSTTASVTVSVLPPVVVQVIRRASVSAAYIDQIAEVDRSAGGGRGHNDIGNRVGIFRIVLKDSE
jgi:hypothetical protein